MKKGYLFYLLFAVSFYQPARAQSSSTGLVSLRSVIHSVESNTDYRFLYRDALVSDISIPSQPNTTSYIPRLDSLLHSHQIGVKVDTGRRQIFLYQESNEAKVTVSTLSGHVVDAQTGSRLPFATISWKINGKVSGTSTDQNGSFIIRGSNNTDDSNRTLTISYIGYQKQIIDWSPTNTPNTDLTIRLEPDAYTGNEVIITGNHFYQSYPSEFSKFLRLGTFSPVGETSTIRALQEFPAVSLNAGLTNGLHIRGSGSDGLRVTLDGATVYDQSHLFGLLDVFNSDVMQTVGFHYDITPAEYEGALGGTLQLLTRTGSQQQYTATTGISNTSYKATVQGPLLEGRGSFLLSGRHSLMNEINWFNNTDLISWGLNVDRPRSNFPDGIQTLTSQAVFPGTPHASFFDLHGKFQYETNKGTRFTLSSYIGGDFTNQPQQYYAITGNAHAMRERFKLKDANTVNNWGNDILSFKIDQPLPDNGFSHTTAAYSFYHSWYSKDNFLYFYKTVNTTRLHYFQSPYSNKNQLSDFKIDQLFELPAPFGGLWSTGFTYHNYQVLYQEESIKFPGYGHNFKSNEFDAYLQFDQQQWDDIHLHIGGRLIYYSDGSFLRFSPRLKLRILPDKPVSFGIGYSRNYQFQHRLTIDHESSSDIWVPTTKNEAPSSDDYWSTGVYIHPASKTYFQTEAYIKKYRNLRLEDLQYAVLTQQPVYTPWFYQNSGRARGVEFSFQQYFGPVLWSSSYTLSRIEIKNEAISGSSWYPAEWDRTHSVTTGLQIPIFKGLTTFLNGMFASGSANPLHQYDSSEPARLPPYYRVDASLTFHQKIGDTKWDLTLSLYNLLDRKNVWYRDRFLVVDNSTSIPGLEYMPANVYDLGLQPSFTLNVSF